MEEYSTLTDTSDEEESEDQQPPKRLRLNTLGASSQSDSSSNHPGASDGLSQSESEGEMGPPHEKNTYQHHETKFPYVDTLHSEKVQNKKSMGYNPGKALDNQEQERTPSAETSPQSQRIGFEDNYVMSSRSFDREDTNKNGDRSSDSLVYVPGKDLEKKERSKKAFASLPKPTTIFSEKAQKMMKTMGYSIGKGLGKLEQGRTAPIETSTQKGRTGLGYLNMLGKLPEDISWDPETDYADPVETPSWMPDPPNEELSSDTLDDWLSEGPIKLTIDDETNFCEPDMLRHVLASKTIFDTLKEDELRRARTRSNPYETIGSMFFLNRAAVKMANMDAVFDFMFTDPKNKDDSKVVDKNSLLYFADVCAGPGGFSEYVLWRKKWKAKGFGFTLKKQNDFKLSDFYAGPPETFTPYYGVEDDGDVTNPNNLESLKDYVLRYTEDIGVHFLMADGGFSVENQENIQEILSKKLYLCQCIAALNLVRPGGHFVVKLFDLFTPFSIGLIYLMYRSFDKVCIHKPRTSRPANSERYLVCKWKRADSDVIGRHLSRVNQRLWMNQRMNSEMDIVQLVPLKVIRQDKEFYNYICNSNNTLGERQVQALLKIAAFCKDNTLVETRQAVVKKECLSIWKLPNMVRTAPQQWKVDDMVNEVMKLLKCRYDYASDLNGFKSNVFHKIPKALSSLSDLKSELFSTYDWHFAFVDHNQSSTAGHGSFFLGLGGVNVKEIPGGNWDTGNVTGDSVPRLPSLTIAWGETVGELKKEKKGQQKSKAIYLLDALVIGGEPIAHLHFLERHKQVQLLCSALDNGRSVIRCKRTWGLEEVDRVLGALEKRVMKSGATAAVSMLPRQPNEEHQPYHAVGGLILLKATQDPWHCFMSKKHNQRYFFGPKNRSLFWLEKPVEACKHALETHQKRLLWRWEPPSEVLWAKHPTDSTSQDPKQPLTLPSFFQMIREKM